MAYRAHIAADAKRECSGALAYVAKRFASPRAMYTFADAFDAAIKELSVRPQASSIDIRASEAGGREIGQFTMHQRLLRYSSDEKQRHAEVYSRLHM